MNPDRRKFLQQLAAVCAGGVARTLGIGCTSAVAAHAAVSTVAATAAVATSATAVGGSIRSQVFEVIVRQGMAGAPWREICQGPMQINNISEAEIQTEINRRTCSHKASNCECSLCVSKRHAEHRKLLLSRIRHSDKSPCACTECYKAVQQIIADALTTPLG
jgi:hypothetical protein